MQKSLGGGQKEEDFFSRRKEKFMQKAVDLGYDLIAVQDFIEEQGIYEENIEIVLDHLNDPSFVNPLKRNYVPPQNPLKGGQVQYKYQDTIQPIQPVQPLNSTLNSSQQLLSTRMIGL